MNEPMTEEEFLAKMEWEGGPLEACIYGLSSNSLPNPNTPVAEAYRRVEKAIESIRGDLDLLEIAAEAEE